MSKLPGVGVEQAISIVKDDILELFREMYPAAVTDEAPAGLKQSLRNLLSLVGFHVDQSLGYQKMNKDMVIAWSTIYASSLAAGMGKTFALEAADEGLREVKNRLQESNSLLLG